jgi:mRNA interferase RelE/StbE
MPKPDEDALSDYRIFETEEFQKRLAKVTSSQKSIIEKKLSGYVYPQLKTAPYYGPNIKKLKGYDPDTWRYRIGNYRIFYIVNEQEHVVFLLTIDDRKDIYR